MKTAQDEVLNLCANNYLGLANHPAVRLLNALDTRLRMASVQFICDPRTCTASEGRQFWAPQTRFCTVRVLMPTAVYFERCLATRTRLSLTG